MKTQEKRKKLLIQRTTLSFVIIAITLAKSTKSSKTSKADNKTTPRLEKAVLDQINALKRTKSHQYLARFTILDPEGKETNNKLGRFSIKFREEKKKGNLSVYELEFLKKNHHASKGHSIIFKMNLTRFIKEKGLKNNTTYEMEYSENQANMRIPNTNLTFNATISFDKVLNSSMGLYEGLRLSPVNSSITVPILPNGFTYNVKIIKNAKDEPNYLTCPMILIFIFLVSSINARLPPHGEICNIHFSVWGWMTCFFYWFSFYKSQRPALVLGFTAGYCISCSFVILDFVMNSCYRFKLSCFKINFYHILRSYRWRDKVSVGLALGSFVAAMTRFPDYHHFLFWLMPLMWVIDHKRLDGTQSVYMMMIRSYPLTLFVMAEYYLPFYWLQDTNFEYESNLLVEVESRGLITFLGTGIAVNSLIYYLFFVKRIGEQVDLVDNIVLKYKALHSRRRKNPLLILKSIFGRHSTGRDPVIDASPASLDLKVPLYLPGWNNLVVEAETRPDPNHGFQKSTIDQTGWIGGFKNNKGKVAMSSIKSKFRPCIGRRPSCSLEWKLNSKLANWKFKLFNCLDFHPLKDLDLRIQEVDNQSGAVRRPLITAFHQTKQAIFEPRLRKVLYRANNDGRMIRYYLLWEDYRIRLRIEKHYQMKTTIAKSRVINALVTEIRCLTCRRPGDEALETIRLRNDPVIEFTVRGKKVERTFPSELRSPQFRYSTKLDLFVFTGFGDTILVILKGKNKCSGYVYEVVETQENSPPSSDGSQEELIEQRNVKIEKISELNEDALQGVEVVGGFFIEERLICLTTGSSIVLWRVDARGIDRYWRVKIGGMGSWFNFRQTKYDRVKQLIWYYSGFRVDVLCFGKEIRECGFVDLKPILKNLSLFGAEFIEGSEGGLGYSFETEYELLRGNER